METFFKGLVTVTVLVLGTIAVGATVALGWNWFIRDELFPTVTTMNVGVGVAIRIMFTVLTLHQYDLDDDDPAILGGIMALILAAVASSIFLVIKLFMGGV